MDYVVANAIDRLTRAVQEVAKQLMRANEIQEARDKRETLTLRKDLS